MSDPVQRTYPRVPVTGWTAQTADEAFAVLFQLMEMLTDDGAPDNRAPMIQLLARVWRFNSPILRAIDKAPELQGPARGGPFAIEFTELAQTRADTMRRKFEDAMFSERFIHSIRRTGLGGPCELMPVDCPTKEEFTARDEKGDYKDEHLSAMWFGFSKAIELVRQGEVS